MVLHLDRTLGPSDDARERMRVSGWYRRLKGKTHFTDHELKCVLLLFHKLTAPERRYLTAHQFFYILRVQFEIYDRNMLTRIFSFTERDNAPGVGPEEWVFLLNLYLHGTLEEKIAFNWRVLDNIGKGFLDGDDVVALTRNHLGPHATDEEKNEFADDVIRFFDRNGDEVISFEDYREAVLGEPSELNTLGRACPEPHVVTTFLATFAPKVCSP